MKPLKVAFRADASLQIGTGHVMRCLTLANTLRQAGCECLFVTRELQGHLADRIESHGFKSNACMLPSPDLNHPPGPCMPPGLVFRGSGMRPRARPPLRLFNRTGWCWITMLSIGIGKHHSGAGALQNCL